jgi:hypothetical protein
MAGVGDTMISLKRWSQASCGSRGNAREPNVNTYKLHTGEQKIARKALPRNASMGNQGEADAAACRFSSSVGDVASKNVDRYLDRIEFFVPKGL